MLRFKYIFNYVIFSIFILYFDFFNIGIETLPFATSLILLFIIMINFISINEFNLSSTEIQILIFLIILFFYCIITFHFFGWQSVVDYLKYAIGPLLFFVCNRHIHRLNKNVLIVILLIISIITILVLLRVDIVHSILKTFIPRIKLSINFRGLSVVTSEPSYFAFYTMLLLSLTLYLYEKKEIIYKEKLFLTLIIVLVSILTLSALVFLVLFIYFLIELIYYNKKIFFIVITVFFIVIILFQNILPKNRITDIISSFKKLIIDGNIFYFLFFVEPSGSTRLILNSIAILNLFLNPFGSGLGSFHMTYKIVAKKFGIPIYNHEVINSIIYSDKISAQTYFCNLINDIGVFSFIYFIIFFKNIDKKISKKLKSLLIIFILILTFFQGQITNPVLWVLLILLKEKRSLYKKRL